MTYNIFRKFLSGKTVLAAVLPLLCAVFFAPAAFAQTAEIRSAGVYYIDSAGSDINDIYCNWGTQEIKDAGVAAYKSGIVNVDGHITQDPWDTSALIEYDQPYPDPTTSNSYPNHCLALCMDVYCTNKPNGASTYSISFPIQNIIFEIARYNRSQGVANPDTNPAVHTIYQSIMDNSIVSPSSSALQTYQQALKTWSEAEKTWQAAYNKFNTLTAGYGEDFQTAYQQAQNALELAVDKFTHSILFECREIRYTAPSSGLPMAECVADDTCFDITKDSNPIFTCTPQVECETDPTCAAAWASVQTAGNILTSTQSTYQKLDAASPGYGNAYLDYSKAKAAYQAAETAFQQAQKQYQESISGSTEVQDLANYMCAGYTCLGATGDFDKTTTCPNPEYECITKTSTNGSIAICTPDSSNNLCCRSLTEGGVYNLVASTTTCTRTSGPGETRCILRSGSGKGYNDPIRFCAPWDGSQEILGEFGKINGQYGFRATIRSEVPGDGIAVESISINQTFPYPGNAQYPIQVDVTNVHTVRSTPSVVGSITAVQALPYTLAYRLSKDSDVNIKIFDASAAIPTTNQGGVSNPAGDNTMSSESVDLVLQQNAVVRNLVDWQPRLGEGMKGSDSDQYIRESDSWDGRDDDGRLLPANNYLVSIQAKSQDEWPGTDFSRAVTRQMSVDPLKLTDIQVEGLNKQSTAYATIRYVPTEASTVYFQVYSPGTQFDSLYTKGYQETGTAPAIKNDSGTLIYSSQQERGRAMSYPDKWDGLCHQAGGCAIPYSQGTKLPITGTVFDGTAGTCTGDGGTITNNNCVITYANNAPLPDGNYIYVLWAEVPYTDMYFNGAACYQCTNAGTHAVAGCDMTLNGTTVTCPGGYSFSNDVATVQAGAYTGVKTQVYYTGTLPVERGVVDITIQPVSYSTIGSSPTAYGLDPFIFKYSVARESTVEAYVQNTAGITVKTLTDEGGNTNVAQQMNTLTWDGRDDQGRMVGPGTYMFVVKTKDPMFPQSVQTTASAIFPVDLYRVVDVSSTDVYGDSQAKATINYKVSKAMNVQVNIYNKDVVIPAQNQSAATTEEVLTQVPIDWTAQPGLPDLAPGTQLPTTVTNAGLATPDDISGTRIIYTEPIYDKAANAFVYYAVTKTMTLDDPANITYTVPAGGIVKYTVPVTPWPPRVCNKNTDSAYFNTNGSINPATQPQCIYVNDPNFTNYPRTPEAAEYNYTEGAEQTLDVRLQPVKTFNRSALKAGDGVTITEEWDAQYFYNPAPISTTDGGKNTPEVVAACANQTDLKNCPYEMVPDGTYPFYISAQTEEPVDLYYDQTTAQPLKAGEVISQTGLYATDKPVYRVNVTRGPVYFIDGSVAVYPNAPQLFNTSSGPIFVPPYEINFAISRAATVEVAIVALENNLCTTSNTDGLTYNNKAGDVCKYLSTMTIVNTPNFDPNIVRKLYWDGTDNNGKYVRNGNYEIRLTAKNYPDPGLYEPTVKQLTLNVDLLKVFDLPEAESYALNKRGTDMKISYQVSVPMKVAIQIFKPGTTIYDYQKGTLRDPATGKEVTDIRDVLVRAIVGIRPATTLIEEVWDGRDYAQQDVPDGTYPFRFVTALNTADIDSVTGEILNSDDANTDPTLWSIEKVADTNQYVNLHRATVAIGDGEFVCEDWEKTVFFYPNPFKTPTGTMEITKLPVPGKMSFKLYNLAGDLVREGGYTCVDANNMTVTMGNSIDLQPDNTVSDTPYTGTMPTLRNAALRCFWDRTNQHGKKVARGVYFGLVDFRAQNGRQHCQKVVKILIPR